MSAHDPWSIFADAEPAQSAAPEQAPSHDPWAAFADAPPQQQAEAQPQGSDAYNTALAPFRGFNKGLADVVSAPYRAIDWAQEQTVGRFTGDLMPDVEDMDMWKYYREPEKAKTTVGHYLQSAGEAVGASAVPAMGLAAAAPKMAAMTASTLPRAVGQAFGESVAKAPATAAMADLTGAATSGAATQYAADEGYGPGVQAMAGLAGGMAPFAPFAAYGVGKAALKVPTTMKALPSDSQNAVRAQQMTQDMKDLGIKPFGPAVAAARRGDNASPALAAHLMDKPFVGKPLLEKRSQYLDEMAFAHSRLMNTAGRPQELSALGAGINSRLEQFSQGTIGDIGEVGKKELQRIATTDPRNLNLPDVQSARYELADRSLPEGKLTGAVVPGEERLMARLPATMEILRGLKARKGRKINKEKSVRDAKGNNPSLQQMEERQPGGFKNPRWTNSSEINESLDAVMSAGGKWSTGVEGMRDIRSDIRRAGEQIGDGPATALQKADTDRLEGAVSQDLQDMFVGANKRAREYALEHTEADRQAEALAAKTRAGLYEDAQLNYRGADDLTRIYKTYLAEARNGITNLRNDESLARGVLRSMGRKQGNKKALRALTRILPDEHLDNISATAIAEMGRPSDAASAALKEAGFSLSQFAKNWFSMSNSAKKIFFSRRPRQRMMLDKLARVAQAGKDFEALKNTSGTGASNVMTAAVSAGGVSLVSPKAAVAMVGAFLLGRAQASYLSRPAYVNWLSRSLDLPPVKFARALKQLRGIALKDRKIGAKERHTLLTLIRQVEGGNDREGWQKPPRGGQPWRRR